MELSDELLCLFHARVEHRDGVYVVEVPDSEVELGTVDDGDTVRVGILGEADGATGDGTTERDRDADHQPDPPVDEGETRRVEIEDVGDQGDGITRVERGFVIIVPETNPGERVKIRVTKVRDNVAFAEVVERDDYFD